VSNYTVLFIGTFVIVLPVLYVVHSIFGEKTLVKMLSAEVETLAKRNGELIKDNIRLRREHAEMKARLPSHERPVSPGPKSVITDLWDKRREKETKADSCYVEPPAPWPRTPAPDYVPGKPSTDPWE